MGFFSKIKNVLTGKRHESYLKGFRPTNLAFKTKFSELEKNFKKVDDNFLENILVILLESDVGYKTAEKIIKQLKSNLTRKSSVQFNLVIDELFSIMAEVYGEQTATLTLNETGPTVILVVGVNGSGKTTTIAKLINYYQKQDKKVAVVAGDTFRAGAVAQLEHWANQLNVPCITGRPNADPSAVLVDGCRYGKENEIDILLCDTAGRLQNKKHLMAELSKMHRVIKREIAGAPHAVWLVIDATTGQNGLAQAEVFIEATSVSGIILSKLDGTAKGGIILGIKDQYQIPVEFVGLGEKIDDLAEFEINTYLYSISEGVYHAQED